MKPSRVASVTSVVLNKVESGFPAFFSDAKYIDDGRYVHPTGPPRGAPSARAMDGQRASRARSSVQTRRSKSVLQVSTAARTLLERFYRQLGPPRTLPERFSGQAGSFRTVWERFRNAKDVRLVRTLTVSSGHRTLLERF